MGLKNGGNGTGSSFLFGKTCFLVRADSFRECFTASWPLKIERLENERSPSNTVVCCRCPKIMNHYYYLPWIPQRVEWLEYDMSQKKGLVSEMVAVSSTVWKKIWDSFPEILEVENDGYVTWGVEVEKPWHRHKWSPGDIVFFLGGGAIGLLA